MFKVQTSVSALIYQLKEALGQVVVYLVEIFGGGVFNIVKNSKKMRIFHYIFVL